ncbi:hypothetical protein MesoLj113b_68210 (plasmid) [Mesorhizobium sp. 113-3-3]|nr:hypothetical protein MesoLj113b_68210 [Mesorhizobium sp. 113-3-3]
MGQIILLTGPERHAIDLNLDGSANGEPEAFQGWPPFLAGASSVLGPAARQPNKLQWPNSNLLSQAETLALV